MSLNKVFPEPTALKSASLFFVQNLKDPSFLAQKLFKAGLISDHACNDAKKVGFSVSDRTTQLLDTVHSVITKDPDPKSKFTEFLKVLSGDPSLAHFVRVLDPSFGKI